MNPAVCESAAGRGNGASALATLPQYASPAGGPMGAGQAAAAAPIRLTLTPITLAQAKQFVRDVHRHSKPPTGWKFGVGIANGDSLVGVATAGRPVSRETQKAEPLTIEVNRTCTDGTRNANSMLYGAIWRAARALGYRRAITYTEGSESGASLRAAGYRVVRELAPRKSWAASTGDPALRAKRSAEGGGIARALWEITA